MLMDRWLLILTIPSVVERNFRHGNTSVSFQLVGSAATRELPASAVEGNPRALVGSAATMSPQRRGGKPSKISSQQTM